MEIEGRYLDDLTKTYICLQTYHLHVYKSTDSDIL